MRQREGGFRRTTISVWDTRPLGTSEILGDDEGLEAQVLDGRREALKRIFQRRNMEGTKEATIVGISTLSCSRPQTLPLSAYPALRLGIWFAWVCEKMPLTLRAVGAEPGERTPDRLGEERNTSKGRSCGRNISEGQAGRPWPGPRTRQPGSRQEEIRLLLISPGKERAEKGRRASSSFKLRSRSRGIGCVVRDLALRHLGQGSVGLGKKEAHADMGSNPSIAPLAVQRQARSSSEPDHSFLSQGCERGNRGQRVRLVQCPAPSSAAHTLAVSVSELVFLPALQIPPGSMLPATGVPRTVRLKVLRKQPSFPKGLRQAQRKICAIPS